MKSRAIMKEKCRTCPFRVGSPVARIASDLAMDALTRASRFCHSTGGNSTVIPKSKNYFKDARICRGSRDVQLVAMHALGVIAAPTDAAWQAKCDEMGIVRDAEKTDSPISRAIT